MFALVDRYVSREWLKIFVLVLGSMFGLQMIVEVRDSFPDLLAFGAGMGKIIVYYAVLAPSFLNISLPAAILVSILYALGLFHRNNEFMAFRASGMSVFRVTRSIWAAALGLSIGLWFLNASLIPWSVERSRVMWEELEWKKQVQAEGDKDVGMVYNLAFDNRRENRMWFINRFSEYKDHAYGVSVSILDAQRRELRRITATEGYYSVVDGHWILLNGRDSLYNPEDGELLRPLRFERIELKELDDDPNLMLLFGERPKDLSFLELKRIADNFTVEDNPNTLGYLVRLHAIIASAASCLIVAGLAIPFSVSGVRVNPAVGISKSIALFFVYYILSSVLDSMGKQGALTPVVAAWAPNVVMILLAYVLLRRVR